MDFLDPKKERFNRIALFVGYGLVAFAIGFASIVLLYQTDGYCVDKKGAVDRCGLVFLSSAPQGSDIQVNGKTESVQTNSKLNLRSGNYDIRLKQSGYRDWQRNITVDGGDVQRFDYPFLFPTKLQTKTVNDYASKLALATQSPDKRWLITLETARPNVFNRYDLKNTSKPLRTNITLPEGLLTVSDGAQSWSFVEWSNDNRHFLAIHGFTKEGAAGQEYILIDRQSVETSRNISRDLGLIAPEQVSLFDKKPDRFYVYNKDTKILRTAATNGTQIAALQLSHIISFKTYGADTVLYITDTPPIGKATAGLVSVILQQGNRSLVLRQQPSGATHYVLDIARYSGDWYVAVGASNERGVRVYRNPFDEKLASSNDTPTPIRFLRIEAVSHVSFSANTQYILAQNGQDFTIYDLEYDDIYRYKTSSPIDPGQEYAKWMDGNRLYYISGGKALVFDYDNQNIQTLQSANPNFPLFFTNDYRYVLSVGDTDPAKSSLSSTALKLN